MIASGSKSTSIVLDIQVLLSPFLFLTSFDCVLGHSCRMLPLYFRDAIWYNGHT